MSRGARFKEEDLRARDGKGGLGNVGRQVMRREGGRARIKGEGFTPPLPQHVTSYVSS